MPSKYEPTFLFGDQTGSVVDSLEALGKSMPGKSSLQNLSTRSMAQIRSAMARSPDVFRGKNCRADSLVELALAAEDEGCGGHSAVNAALLCVAQLGHFIVHVENHPEVLDEVFTAPRPLFGLGTGLVAAAAVACCRTVGQILEISNDTIQLAFNIGLEAARRSDLIEPSRTGCTWAFHVEGIAIEQAANAVNSFNDASVLDHYSKAYVSASSKSGVTICGPPSVTTKLFCQDALLQKSCKTALPITAAFHAEHLDPVPPVKLNIHVDSAVFQRSIVNPNLLSTFSGNLYEARNFGHLISQVQTDILQHSVRFNIAVQRLAKMMPPEATCLAVSPFPMADVIKQTVKEYGVELQESPEGHYVDQAISTGADDIAIVGMAVRLPGGETLEEFWQVLQEGRDLHERIRADRFDLVAHYDPSGARKNTTQTPYGVFIDRPGYFDRHLFNMSPRECLQTDPQHRMLLLATYEALEAAGYAPYSTHCGGHASSTRVGTFIGQTGDDWREVNSSQSIDAHFIPGGMRAFGPGRLHYHFGWDGPSYSIDTACSSSASAIQLAMSALSSHECDMAVSGGVNFLTAPDVFAGLSRGGFLSPTGGCKTFDDAADGYCRADAVGIVILKRYADAVANRDNIVGVLKGAMTNHSAEAVSITHPHAGTQQRLFSALVNKAGLRPADVDYVELHGTGTQAGDTMEATSVTGALTKGRLADRPLYIGSVKPNLGHGEGASGVTSLIKAILILRKDMIPPHIGIKDRMNTRLPQLSRLNTHLPLVATPYPRNPQFVLAGHSRRPRTILVNNFDAAGGNTSIIVQDAPEPVVQGTDPRCHHVVTLSGKTKNSLRKNVKELLQFVRLHPETRLEDIAYTTSARRMHHPWRQVETVASMADLRQSLDRAEAEDIWERGAVGSLPVVFVFTGQASPDNFMAPDLFSTCGYIRESILDMERISLSHGFPSFLPVITDPECAKQANPVQAQLALVAVELALASFWRSLGIVPDAVIGHSLGEFPALCTAGVLSVSTCLYLVGHRASLMVNKCSTDTHAMLVIPLAHEQMGEYLRDLNTKQCDIACINGPTSTVVAGTKEEISVVEQQLQGQGTKTTRLDVPFAFHSPQIDAIMDEYSHAADRVSFSPPDISVLSSTLGRTVSPGDSTINAAYLKQHTRGQVKFSAAVQGLSPLNRLRVWIEMGPHPTCLGMIRRILDGQEALLLPSLKRGEPGWKVMAGSLGSAHQAGLPVHWREYHRPYETSLRLLELPSYSFDLENFWLQYKGNWSVVKGDATIPISSQDHLSKTTTSVCRVETHVRDANGVTATFTSDPSEPMLKSILSGHRVNGVHLCSSSVYAEMAFAAVRSLQRAWGTSHEAGSTDKGDLEVRGMQIQQPLVIGSGDRTGQIIRLVASQSAPLEAVHIQISSQDDDAGTAVKNHAKCLVVYDSQRNSRPSTWMQYGHLVRARMDQLIASSASGPTHRILKSMVYKLFGALVDYAEPYQALQEVFMDSECREAVAKLRLSASAQSTDVDFIYNPCWIDGMFHLSGFVLNGAETTPADVVYISHGWDSMRVLVPKLEAEKTYHAYVHMREESDTRGGLMVGDVHVFELDEVVALCQGIRFQRIKRALLDDMLPTPPRSRNSSSCGLATDTGSSSGQDTPISNSEIAKGDLNNAKTQDQTDESHVDQTRSLIRRIVASEIGLDNVDALEADSPLDDLGVDSLLGLSIVSAIKKQTGLVLNSSFFLTSDPTIRAMEHALGLRLDTTETQICDKAHGHSRKDASILGTTSLASTEEAEAVLLSTRPAHLHPTGMTLFLLPDGSGSAASYTGLAASLERGSDAYRGLDAVYGLNSPFLRCPEQFRDGQSSVSDVSRAFAAAICRIQPAGPYYLGGWSIGGTYAFEVAGLLSEGTGGPSARKHQPVVARLVLIDAPCPAALPALPLAAVDLLADLGVLGPNDPDADSGKCASAARAHFEGSLRVLRQYEPEKWPTAAAGSNMPLVTSIWARQGVWETVGGQTRARGDFLLREAEGAMSSPATDWIMNPRETYGPGSWDVLLLSAQFSCHNVDGDHFSMMRRSNVGQIGDILLREFAGKIE